MTEDHSQENVEKGGSEQQSGNGASDGETTTERVAKSSIELELAAAASSQKRFNVNDRVRTVSGNRCLGVVKEVREELVSPTDEGRDRVKMIKVLWDNGTFSYFGPDGLELVEGA